MSLSEHRIDELCALVGIEREYWDISGHHCVASREAKLSLLQVLGVLPGSDEECDKLCYRIRFEKASRVLPPLVLPKRGGEKYSVRLQLPVHENHVHIEWTITEESGRVQCGEASTDSLPCLEAYEFDGKAFHAYELLLPYPEECGYHQLTVQVGTSHDGSSQSCPLIFAPERCFIPAHFRFEDSNSPPQDRVSERVWGISVQLYSLRGESGWGIGDFGDLRQAIPRLSQCGLDIIGLNPLHALASEPGDNCSPYSPNSRLVWNSLYLPICSLADFKECPEAQNFVSLKETRDEISLLQSQTIIDYRRVAKLKLAALRYMFSNFANNHIAQSTVRAEDFAQFVESQGEGLYLYALHETLKKHFESEECASPHWHYWPTEYKNPMSPQVQKFAEGNKSDIQFYQYVQWLTYCELKELSELCQREGMRIGLYTDLALGADSAGAETWGQQEAYAFGASMGAPPDELGPLGQDWGLPALHPEKLLTRGLQPFIRALRSSMLGAGAIRIDHVMSLFRLYLVPHGLSPKEGAYVRYPFEALLAIVAIESARSQCLVIGEDLGTVPNEVRTGMESSDILSYKVLYFMKNGPAFLRPDEYPRMSLAVASTHDLATLAGYWDAHDLDTRESLGLNASEEIAAKIRAGRAQDRRELVARLVAEGMLAADRTEAYLAEPMSQELARIIHQFLARSLSLVQTIQLEDIVLETEQANVPGTVNEHPNWRRRMKTPLAEILSSEEFLRLSKELASLRPRQVQI